MLTKEQKSLIDKLSGIDNIAEALKLLAQQTSDNLSETRKVHHDIARIIEEKTTGFPWLADAISQYFEMRDLKIAEFLDRKLRPAMSSAERVREIAGEKRVLQKKLRVTRNLIRYYEALFPWLSEFVGEDVDELLVQVGEQAEKETGTEDRSLGYLTDGEKKQLSRTECYQRALDRYWQRRKTPWQIGRDYERYVGYLYEKEGFSVYYQGIVAGLEDLGRDLIAKAPDRTEVIQCKRWSEHKTIHEKHICQLFGTTLKYWIENRPSVSEPAGQQLELFPAMLEQERIRGVFVTSTSLSETAREFAKELGIVVREEFPFDRYPCIKCNVSRQTGEKIYHLPFDQQYDKTVIEEERNECYVETVVEAEKLGFRRAFRWRGAH